MLLSHHILNNSKITKTLDFYFMEALPLRNIIINVLFSLNITPLILKLGNVKYLYMSLNLLVGIKLSPFPDL